MGKNINASQTSQCMYLDVDMYCGVAHHLCHLCLVCTKNADEPSLFLRRGGDLSTSPTVHEHQIQFDTDSAGLPICDAETFTGTRDIDPTCGVQGIKGGPCTKPLIVLAERRM